MFDTFPFSQWNHIPSPTKSFKGQTIIVTGSNTGLGLEAARHFVNLDAARVILAVRTVKKGEDAKANIEASSGRKGVVEVWQLDMSNYDNIKAFSKKVQGLDRIDVVIENAGISTDEFVLQEGSESTVTVNVIGTFLLALELLPTLRKSGEKTGVVPRLAITSSEVHAWSSMSERLEDSIFDALNKNNKKYMSERYMTSKLLEVFAVRELAAEMQSGAHAKQPVILNTLNPGLCHSELTRDAKGIQHYFLVIMKYLIARTTEVGGRTLVAAATAGEESHGQYMSDGLVKNTSSFVRSEEGAKTQARVWAELKAILEGIQPGILGNI